MGMKFSKIFLLCSLIFWIEGNELDVLFKNCVYLILCFTGKSHGQRSLVGCSPWGGEESDMTEQLHFHFSLLCIGEGNGKPLQCSCLENPRDGVAQSRTRLEWLSSSICKYIYIYIYIHTHIYNIYIAYINIYICIHTKSWSTVSELQRSKRGHWICYR